MPTYEYKCTQDDSTFEVWQEVGAEAPPCPTCGAATKKVFHPTRVIFKGSGFYVTDLRAEQSAKSGGAKSEGGSSSSSTTSAASAPAASTPAPAAPAAPAAGPSAPAPAGK